GSRAGLAGPELHAPAGHEVERGDSLGDAGRMVHLRHDVHDAVAQPDPRGALARRREEHLRRGRVRVLLHEVVLDLPHVVEAGAVRDLDLLERVVVQALLGAVLPRAGKLVLVEEPEPHQATSTGTDGTARGSRSSSTTRAPLAGG